MFKGGFSIKKKETAIVKNGLQRGFEKVEEEKSDAEIILAVDDKGIIGTKKVEEKNPLVIPCIQVNKWSIETSDKTSTSKKRKIDLGEQKANKKLFLDAPIDDAVKAILSDTNKFMEQQEEKTDTLKLNIPILLQNQIPDGEELEEGPLKVDIRPESSNLDDYDAVPIDAFGLGMLRGMGWEEKEGIGKNKQKISEIKMTMRPKGLGLGAIPVAKREVAKDSNNENLMMRNGSFVKIIDGPYKDRYGKVLSIDGDLGRVTLVWALGKHDKAEVNEIFTQVVTQKEYNENGKDISRKGKEEIERKRKIIEDEKKQQEFEKNKDLKKSTKEKQRDKKSEAKWAHIGLIVQFMGDRKSKHYRVKFEIRKITSRQEINCRNMETDETYDFHERDLQTVVPHDKGAVVMILSGSLSGSFGEVIDRQKERERVMVRIFNKHKDVEQIKFDNVCLFNGTTHDF